MFVYPSCVYLTSDYPPELDASEFNHDSKTDPFLYYPIRNLIAPFLDHSSTSIAHNDVHSSQTPPCRMWTIPPVTPDLLTRTVQEFLSDASGAVVLEEGTVAFDLGQAKYSISGDDNECLILVVPGTKHRAPRARRRSQKRNLEAGGGAAARTVSPHPAGNLPRTRPALAVRKESRAPAANRSCAAPPGSPHRAMLDVLATTRDGRLAVVELKADEDIHLPLVKSGVASQSRRISPLRIFSRSRVIGRKAAAVPGSARLARSSHNRHIAPIHLSRNRMGIRRH